MLQLFPSSSWRAASSTCSFLSSTRASLSELLRAGIGSPSRSARPAAAEGAGVSLAVRLTVGATGTTARKSHEAISSSNTSISPNSRAAHHRPRSAIGGIAAAYTPPAAGAIWSVDFHLIVSMSAADAVDRVSMPDFPAANDSR